MTNKKLLIFFAAAVLFILGYFAISPKPEITEPLNDKSQIAVAPPSTTPVIEASAVKPPNVATEVLPTIGNVAAASNPAALKTFDQFTPIERDRLRLDFDAMSEPDRLFAVISAEDEAWKKENFFPDKRYIETTDEATFERLAYSRPRDKTALNALIYKWWLRNDPRWKENAQMAANSGSTFAARLLLNEELNTFGKPIDVEEAFRLQTIILLSGDDASHRFIMRNPGLFARFGGDTALSILNDCLFHMNVAQRIDRKAGIPIYTRRPRPRVPWMKAY
jgi:hypothetical protein